MISNLFTNIFDINKIIFYEISKILYYQYIFNIEPQTRFEINFNEILLGS